MKKILIFCTALLLFSCTDENVAIDKAPENKIFSIQDYFDFLKIKTKNSLTIQNYSSWFSPITSSAISTKSEGNTNGLFFKLDNIEYRSSVSTPAKDNIGWTQDRVDMSNVYGNKVNVSFGIDPAALAACKTTSVYVPNILKIDYLNLNNDGKVVAGTTVTWNADNLNTKGVVLALEYIPSSQTDRSVLAAYPKRIMNGKTIGDMGTYTITAEDLNLYPDNASLDFIVGRGSFVIMNDGNPNNDLSFSAFSQVRTMFKIDKPK